MTRVDTWTVSNRDLQRARGQPDARVCMVRQRAGWKWQELVGAVTAELTASERRVLAMLVERLREERDGAVRELLDVLRVRVPEYRAITDDRSLDLIRGGISYVFDVGVATLEIGRELSPLEVAQLRTLGGQRATQGLALESVLRGVRVAIDGVMRLVQAKLARIDATPRLRATVGLHVGTHLIRMAEAFSTAIEQGFRAEGRPPPATPLQPDPQDRHRERDLRTMLEGSAPGSSRIGAVDLERPSALILLAVDDSLGQSTLGVMRAARLRITESTERLASCIVQARGRRSPVLAILVGVETAKDWKRIRSSFEALVLETRVLGALVALPPAVHSPVSVRHAYLASMQSFRVGALLARGRVIEAEDLRFLRVLCSDVTVVCAFVQSVLGELLRETAYRRDILADTLTAYFAARSRVKTAAAKLGCHERTVRERLDRFAALTQQDLDKNRLDIELALALRPVWEGARPTSSFGGRPKAQD